MKWWGFEQDFEGEDLIVSGGGYGGVIEGVRRRVERAGEVIKLNEEVFEVSQGEETITVQTTHDT